MPREAGVCGADVALDRRHVEVDLGDLAERSAGSECALEEVDRFLVGIARERLFGREDQQRQRALGVTGKLPVVGAASQAALALFLGRLLERLRRTPVEALNPTRGVLRRTSRGPAAHGRA